MKKILFLAALAATVGFASCSKDGSENPASGDNVLLVQLPGNVVTRSVQDQVTTNSTTVLADVTVFLLNGDAVVGTPIDFAVADISAKYKRIEQVPSTVNKVLVVANIPSAESAAVKALTSATAIKNYAFTIANQNTGNGINNKTHMGDAVAVVDTDPVPDGHVYKKATVTLNALTARFEIGAVKKGVGVESVELVGVWINNYYTDGKATVQLNNNASTYWDMNPATSTSPATTPFGTVTPTVPYVPAAYYDAYSPSVTVAAGSSVYAYHVFAGSNIPHVVMLVKGEYTTEQTPGAGDKYFLGFVTFNKFVDGGSPITSIVANTIYKIGVGSTGITIDAKDITPEPELTNFDLGVTVTITPWTEKVVTPGV